VGEHVGVDALQRLAVLLARWTHYERQRANSLERAKGLGNTCR
jgi:hypothetical protein